jgi:hypothetical protein
VDEFPEVSFYVLSEPALSAAPPDEINIWQELAHLRTENYAWRDCVTSILGEVDRHPRSTDALKAAIEQRVVALGERVARAHHR